MLGTCVRWGMSVKYTAVKFLAVPLPKRPCNGRLTSETAVRQRPCDGRPLSVTAADIAAALYQSLSMHDMHQRRSFKLDPSRAKCPGSGTEVIPGEHPDTRIKPLPLTNGHGRYMTVTPERTLVSVGEWPLHTTVIIFNRCTSETVSQRPFRF
jgi:hypothetical protein